METITISMQRYEELIRTHLVYKLKKQELEKAGYVSEVDRVLFEVSEKTAKPAEDDF